MTFSDNNPRDKKYIVLAGGGAGIFPAARFEHIAPVYKIQK